MSAVVPDQLPGKSGSCWLATANPTDYPALDSSIHAETVVVGAGIVGLTVALRLCEAVRAVTVLEALRVGGQVTGRSTAKITTQHALIYRHLIDTLGYGRAQLYADANRAAARQIGEWIGAHGIACDYERKAAHTYTQRADRYSEIESEANAARQLGLQAESLDRAPLPFGTAGALCFIDQAQFNPASYLVELAGVIS